MKRNIILIVLLFAFISCSEPYDSRGGRGETWSVGVVNELSNLIYVIVEFRGGSSQILFVAPEKTVFTDNIRMWLSKDESLNAGNGIRKITIIYEFEAMPIILEKEQMDEYLVRNEREIGIDDILEGREYDDVVVEFILEVTEDLKELVE